MKRLTAFLLAATLMCSSLSACVNYDPKSGKYTIDQSGCVGK